MLEPRIAATYDAWRAQPGLPEDLAAELASIQGDEEAITDRFYRELAFGTGGLRGVIGAGANRMNVYNIRKATQGLADYLNATALPKKVAIAHDSRHNGDVFARETARVLAANGITAYLYPRLEPTLALSWATRYLGCGAGICVTASHNPAKYNGYKVYGADGCQITLEVADQVLKAIEQHDYFDSIRVMDYDAGGTGLPAADVLEYRLAGGAKFMVRPSGTEPKIKVYLSAVGKSEAEADAVNERMAQAAAEMMHA